MIRYARRRSGESTKIAPQSDEAAIAKEILRETWAGAADRRRGLKV